MRKRPLLLSLVSLGLLSLSSYALAADIATTPPSMDNSVCTALIDQGNAVPVIPTSNLQVLQTCMNNCDSLYRTLGEQKNYVAMINKTAYCRKSLNNLYFSSVAQTINDDLDLRTQQQNSVSSYSLMEQIKAQQNQAKQNQQQNNAVNSSMESTDSNESTPSRSNSATPPPVSTDGINWF